MCERATHVDCMSALASIVVTEENLRSDALTYKDFDNLKALVKFLTLFRTTTLATEGIIDSIDMVLLTYEALLAHLKNQRVVWASNIFMSERVEAAWSKFV